MTAAAAPASKPGGPVPEAASVFSGTSGTVRGRRRRAIAGALDRAMGIHAATTFQTARIHRKARRSPKRRILALSIYRRENASLLAGAMAELRRSRHTVEARLGSTSQPAPRLAGETVLANLSGGKFDNLNRLIDGLDLDVFDAVIVLDDDIELPRHFLDNFMFLVEAFNLDLAQPALTRKSHGAWSVCRRQMFTVARQTRFVEIGPLTLFRGPAKGELLPFPEVGMGWGLDLHWGAVARSRGRRTGVVDATPIAHDAVPPGVGYDRTAAERQALEFLRTVPHLTRTQALETVAFYRRIP